MTARPVEITKAKLAAARRMANTQPTSARRNYANAYITWLAGGAVGDQPRRGGVLRKTAQLLRAEIDNMQLWVG